MLHQPDNLPKERIYTSDLSETQLASSYISFQRKKLEINREKRFSRLFENTDFVDLSMTKGSQRNLSGFDNSWKNHLEYSDNIWRKDVEGFIST